MILKSKAPKSPEGGFEANANVNQMHFLKFSEPDLLNIFFFASKAYQTAYLCNIF
jgi:hypothetical protein